MNRWVWSLSLHFTLWVFEFWVLSIWAVCPLESLELKRGRKFKQRQRQRQRQTEVCLLHRNQTVNTSWRVQHTTYTTCRKQDWNKIKAETLKQCVCVRVCVWVARGNRHWNWKHFKWAVMFDKLPWKIWQKKNPTQYSILNVVCLYHYYYYYYFLSLF